MGAAESSQRKPGELFRDPWWNPTSVPQQKEPSPDMKEALKRASEERARLEAELEKSREEIERLEEELENFKEQAAKMGSEARSRLEEERDRYRAEATRLGAELEAERRRTANEQQRLRAELVDLQKKLKEESEARRLAEQMVGRRREPSDSEDQQSRPQRQQQQRFQQSQQRMSDPSQRAHQQEDQQGGGKDEEDTPNRRVLSSRRAAELERFKQEVCVKRESRQRALAAVSGEMGRLRARMERFQLEVEKLAGPEAVAAIELELDRERKTGGGEREDEHQGYKVSLEEDVHLRLEHALNELERERELKRLLEQSLEVTKSDLQAKERLGLELEGVRGELEAERRSKKQLEIELEKMLSELEKQSLENKRLEKERLENKNVDQQEASSESIVCCLQSQLDCERAARRQLEKQIARMVENHAKMSRQRKDEESMDLKSQLETEKESKRQLERRLEEVHESSRLQQLEIDRLNERAQTQRSAEELQEQDEELTRLREQVSALKEVATVGKQLLLLREQQVERLEARLEAAGSPPGAAEAALGELRAEYERQLRNMDELRRLYGERAAAAAEEASKLRGRLDEEREARGAAEGRLEQAQEALERAQCDAEEVRGDMSQINNAFAQLLAAAAGGGEQGATVDLDELARRLHQNSGLLADIAAAEDEDAGSARLSRTLLELAAQMEAEEGAAPTTPDDPDGGVPASMGQAQIASNLPKVWKVLSELLQAAEQPAPGSGPPPTDVKSACYKSVDTPGGPRLVISVSQTFLRLKDLILEKKSLQRELARLQKLNGHLETKLGRQQRRLALVSTELRKTWGVVGRMRAQHAQLHTHERLLRYELQHKRHLLAELRQELDRGRDSWRKASEVNIQSEIEWRALRREFAARRAHAGSAESGCFSDPGEETTSAATTGNIDDVESGDSKDRSPASPAVSTSPPPSPPVIDDPMPPLLDVETCSCDTVSMVKRLKEQLSWFSRSLDSVARDDEEALRSIFSLPAIRIPDSVYKLLVDGESTVSDTNHQCEEEGAESPSNLTATDEESPSCTASPDVKELPANEASTEETMPEKCDFPGEDQTEGSSSQNESQRNDKPTATPAVGYSEESVPKSDQCEAVDPLASSELTFSNQSVRIPKEDAASQATSPTKQKVEATENLPPPPPPPLPPPPSPPSPPRIKNLKEMDLRVRTTVERMQNLEAWRQRVSAPSASNGGARSRRIPDDSPTNGNTSKASFRRLSDWEGPAPLTSSPQTVIPITESQVSENGSGLDETRSSSHTSPCERTGMTTTDSSRLPVSAQVSPNPKATASSRDAKKERDSELVYQRLARCLDPGAALRDHIQQQQQKQQQQRAERQQELPTISRSTDTRSPQEVLEARSARLQRLEDQCRQLVNQVTRTTVRGVTLAGRLEELHEQYGSSSSPDSASPGLPSSPVTRRSQLPPQPPPGESKG